MLIQRRGVDLSEKNWLVLYVGSRKEKSVQKTLQARQIDVYLPLRERRYTYSSKTVVRLLPILPGYVFVRPEQHRIGEILGISHVFGFVKNAGNYSLVTEQEMNHLKYLSTTRDLEWCEVAPDEIANGSLVEIKRGALAGLRGRLVARKGQSVFLISFNDKMTTQLGIFEIDPSNFTVVDGASAA